MKRRIILGSLLSVLILMMLPSISAVEYNTAEEANDARLLDQIENMNIAGLKGIIQSIDFEEFKEKIQNTDIKAAVKELKENLKDDPAQPQIVSILGIILGIIIGILSRTTVGIAAAVVCILISLTSLLFKISIIGIVLAAIMIVLEQSSGGEEGTVFGKIQNMDLKGLKENLDENDPSPQFIGILGVILGIIAGLIVRIAVLSIATILDILIFLTPLMLLILYKLARMGITIAAIMIVLLKLTEDPNEGGSFAI